ncbi:MAG: hypothetical protein PWQ18_248, partial [Clostridia bacterium]|nr:hypothetical protein [Clostridia bacterium]
MGYQAPVVLLAAIAFLALAYSWFGWRQKTTNCCCPCLTLLLDNQESFLEGLLRQFLRWSYWHGTPWRLRVILYSPAQATIAILRHFLNLYPFDLEVTVDQEPPWRAGSE